MSRHPGREARAAEDVARAAYGRLLAILASRSRDIAAAEDALADAFEAALRTWPDRGVPDRPEAWLLTTARNRQTDRARRDARMDLTGTVPEMETLALDPDALPDDRLKLLFVCAHPAIDEGVRTPLMLQTVLGIEAAEIARAFLVSPAAMSQRLVRAKAKIRDSGMPFAVPGPEALPARLASVLEAIYGAYALDWIGAEEALSFEALYLASVLASLLQNDPEALGLAALLSFVHSRREARVREGVFVPVPEQDTGLWDRALMDQARHLLARASAMGRPGRFQIEAAINDVHAARRETGVTNWRALSQLYTGLMAIAPTIGAAVARAAAVGEDAGAAAGIALLDRIADADRTRFQPWWATRAHLLAKAGDRKAAVAAYEKAVALSTDPSLRRWLEAARAKL